MGDLGLIALLAGASLLAGEVDCNDNGVPDDEDLRPFAFIVVSDELSPIGAGSPQRYTIVGAPEARNAMVLAFLASADLDDSSEYISVDMNGVDLGEVFRDRYRVCPASPDNDWFVVPFDTFIGARDAADLVFDLTASAFVDTEQCDPPSFVQVRVQYEAAPRSRDCNANGVPDECDIASGASEDCDGDGRPDECTRPPGYAWTRAVQGPTGMSATAVAVDGADNVLVSGSFGDTVDFDPGEGVDEHEAAGGRDLFVTKYHADGTYAWTRTIGGEHDEFAGRLAVDVEGNVLYTGAFLGTVDFDPGEGEDIRRSVDYDAFTSRLDADGGYAWTRTVVGPRSDGARTVAIDSAAKAVVSGWTTNGTGQRDIFIRAYEPDGALAWSALIAVPPGSGASAYAMAIDANDDLVLAGEFEGRMDFDPGESEDIHESNGQRDVFVTRLAGDASHRWTRTVGGTLSDTALAVDVDSEGDVVVAGHFNETVDFDPSAGEDLHTSHGGEDAFVTKLRVDGAYAWTRSFGGTGNDVATALAVDGEDDIIVAGYFEDVVDFDPGPARNLIEALGFTDAFVSRFDADAAYRGTGFFGSYHTLARGLAVDSRRDVLVTGGFLRTVDFDPTGGFDPWSGSIFLTKHRAPSPSDEDCNDNGRPDGCDLADGTSRDDDGNGVPDECECFADLDTDGNVGVADLIRLLAAWGPCPDCAEDLTRDGVVDVHDLLVLLRGWGTCPGSSG